MRPAPHEERPVQDGLQQRGDRRRRPRSRPASGECPSLHGRDAPVDAEPDQERPGHRGRVLQRARRRTSSATRRLCGRSSDAEQRRRPPAQERRRCRAGSRRPVSAATPRHSSAPTRHRRPPRSSSAAADSTARVGRHRCHQLAVGADGDDPCRPARNATRSASATVEGRCTTSERGRARGAPGASAASTERLGVDVERRQRVVEDQHARPADHRPGQRQPLALPAGQREALLADPGVEAPREVVRRSRPAPARAPRRCRRRWRRGGRASGSPARSSRTGPGPRTPRPPDVRSDGQREVADVVAVERDPAARHVVEARDQRRERGLARAGGADDGDVSPGSIARSMSRSTGGSSGSAPG